MEFFAGNQRLLQLQNCQKKAVRIIAGEKYNAHTEPIFKKFKILKVSDLCTLQELKFCFKLENSMLPEYFQTNLFIRNTNIHQHNTRSANAYHIPRIKFVFARNKIQFIIATAYNNAPILIRNKFYTHSFPGFTKYVKNHVIENYSENCSVRNCYICSSP